MANAGSSRVSLRYVKEVTYGVTPATPTMTTVRRVPGGGGLQRNSQVVSSQEADSSRTIPDQVETGYSAAFDYNFELQAGALDDFLIAALGGTTYVASTPAQTTISAVASPNSIHRSAGSFITDGWKPGMWMKISGFTGNVLNNGLVKIGDLDGDVTATDINIVTATKTMIVDAAGEAVTLTGKMVRTGVANQDSFSFEQHFTDLTNVYLRGAGYRPTGISLDATAGNIVTGTVNFLGLNAITSTSAIAGETVTAAGTTQSMNATSNVATLYEGGAAIATLARQITININPNVTELRAISNPAAAGLIDGTFDISIALNLFFSDLSFVTKVINRTPTSLWLPFTDGAGNSIVFTFPKGYVSGTPKEQGQNTPVAQDLTFTPVRYTSLSLTPSIMAQCDFC